MLIVHDRRKRDADAAQCIVSRIELLVPKIEQTAERTAGDVASDVDRTALCPHRDAEAGRIERILHGRDFVGDRAEHERLAVADEHVHRAAVLLHGVDRHLLRELIEQLIALIHQIVRRLTAGTGKARLDVRVDIRDALRERIDLLYFAAQAEAHFIVHVLQARIEILQALLQRLRLAQKDLASRNRSRRVRDALECIHEFLQRRRKPVRRVAEHIVETFGIRCVNVEPLQAARGTASLQGNEVVIHPPHGVDADALPDPAIAVRLCWARAKLDALAAIARRVDVRDIVARRIERALKREQTGYARSEKISHGCSAPSLGCRL